MIFAERKHAFKVIASVGEILKNLITRDYSYYWPLQNNQTVFENPKLVKNISDKDGVINSFQSQVTFCHVGSALRYPMLKGFKVGQNY